MTNEEGIAMLGNTILTAFSWCACGWLWGRLRGRVEGHAARQARVEQRQSTS